MAAIAVLVGAYAAYPLARLTIPRAQRPAFRHPGQPFDTGAVPRHPHCPGRQKDWHERQDHLARLYQSCRSSCPMSSGCCNLISRASPWSWKTPGRIDGCSRLQVVHKIILPLSLPGLTSAGILAFPADLGRVSLRACCSQRSPASYTSTVVVSLFATDVDVSFVSIITAGVLSVIPPICFALVFQRFIISGLLSGSLKGLARGTSGRFDSLESPLTKVPGPQYSQI